MTALPPSDHPRHGWVVDVATHKISRQLCPACSFNSDRAEVGPQASAGHQYESRRSDSLA
jgi:hypothetical protein